MSWQVGDLAVCVDGDQWFNPDNSLSTGPDPRTGETNGQDAKRLEAKPEWPGLAAGEMRPSMAAFLDALSRPTPAQIWLENVARQTLKEGDK